MAYSTADAERIARLKAATRAAEEIVAQAKADGYAIVETARAASLQSHKLGHQQSNTRQP